MLQFGSFAEVEDGASPSCSANARVAGVLPTAPVAATDGVSIPFVACVVHGAEFPEFGAVGERRDVNAAMGRQASEPETWVFFVEAVRVADQGVRRSALTKVTVCCAFPQSVERCFGSGVATWAYVGTPADFRDSIAGPHASRRTCNDEARSVVITLRSEPPDVAPEVQGVGRSVLQATTVVMARRLAPCLVLDGELDCLLEWRPVTGWVGQCFYGCFVAVAFGAYPFPWVWAFPTCTEQDVDEGAHGALALPPALFGFGFDDGVADARPSFLRSAAIFRRSS